MSCCPSVSIVIPVKNGADTIGDMLSALFNQAWAPHDLEIIVVDNGSTDRTRDVVKQFDVTLLEETTPGVSAARNRGLKQARGEIYISVDADTLPTRYWLKEIVAPFSDPDVILVGGKIISYKPETGAERYIESAGLYDPKNSVTNAHIPFVVGMNLAVRRGAALAIGGWAEELLRADDIDFSYRLNRHRPLVIHYQPKAVIFHRNRQTDKGLKDQARGYGYGAALIYRRYPETINWGAWEILKVACLLVHRAALPFIMGLGHRVGKVSDAQLEFVTYQRMWTWAFWSAFLRTFYTKRNGQARQP